MSPLYPLLGLLTQGERHGYDLKRTIDREFAPYWRLDFAQLYRSLARLARAGWVKVRVEPGVGGPKRKVYALTPPGRRAFEAWLAEPAAEAAGFFVRIRLAALCGAPARGLVTARRRSLEEAHGAQMQAHRAALAAGDPGRLILTDAARRELEAALAALDVCEAVVPQEAGAAGAPAPGRVRITGSDDPLLARLARLARASTHTVGSLGGLFALAQGQADVAGIHLLDAESGEYNLPFVKHFLPEEPVLLVNLARRENGLLLAPGNPRRIRGVRDLGRRGARLINRARGTGTRLLLYSKLRAARLDPHSLPGWESAAATHDAVAAAVAAGVADVGPGLRAVAAAWGLDFIPLGEERYDLVIPRARFESKRLRPLLAALHGAEFRKAARGFEGYDLSNSGRVLARVH